MTKAKYIKSKVIWIVKQALPNVTLKVQKDSNWIYKREKGKKR